jgi:hypothetical protein
MLNATSPFRQGALADTLNIVAEAGGSNREHMLAIRRVRRSFVWITHAQRIELVDPRFSAPIDSATMACRVAVAHDDTTPMYARAHAVFHGE